MNLSNVGTERLKQELVKRGIINVFFSVEDIVSTADSMNITLSVEQIRKVQTNIAHTHDANVGVNWEVIKCHILDVVNKK